jgi:uncharacterized membrane protein
MNMNPAHWHLLVNHLPIIGGLFATLILLGGILRRSTPIANLSLVLFVTCAVLSMIASQTGEKAEHFLKDRKAIDEKYLERHVDAADIANYGMMALGAVALITLIFKRVRNMRFMPYVILIASIVVFILMARAGNLGGEIMHKEIRNDQVQKELKPT